MSGTKTRCLIFISRKIRQIVQLEGWEAGLFWCIEIRREVYKQRNLNLVDQILKCT
jgi:hypothetical protein